MNSICEKSRFLSDTKDHEMTIIRNEGVYRHIRFKKPGTMCMHFDLITWPGYLCYTGDMGTYVFRRLHDMFKFFGCDGNLDQIDFRYWAEKVEAADKYGGIQEFSYEKFQAYIREWIDEHEEASRPDEDELEELENHAAAYAELRNAVEDEVTCCDENEVRCFDEASNFSHDGDAWQVFNGTGSSFEFSDLWDGFDHATKVFTTRFVWCCYALAWGIEQFNKEAKSNQIAPEATT